MNKNQTNYRQCEGGFSYVDVMIAVVILLVGVVALAATLTANLVRSYETEKQIISKQLAVSTIESIISAKDIKRSGSLEGWDTVANVDPNNPNARGIFLNGWTPIREDLGFDGVAGTADDACPVNAICNSNNNPPNTSAILNGYERQIIITDVNDPERPTPPNLIMRKRIDVSIRYAVNQITRQQVVSTLVANY